MNTEKNGQDDRIVHVALSKEDRRLLRQVAAKTDKTIAQIVVEMVRERAQALGIANDAKEVSDVQ